MRRDLRDLRDLRERRREPGIGMDGGIPRFGGGLGKGTNAGLPDGILGERVGIL